MIINLVLSAFVVIEPFFNQIDVFDLYSIFCVLPLWQYVKLVADSFIFRIAPIHFFVANYHLTCLGHAPLSNFRGINQTFIMIIIYVSNICKNYSILHICFIIILIMIAIVIEFIIALHVIYCMRYLGRIFDAWPERVVIEIFQLSNYSGAITMISKTERIW